MKRVVDSVLTARFQKKIPSGKAGYKANEFYEDGTGIALSWFVSPINGSGKDNEFKTKQEAENFIDSLPDYPSSKSFSTTK